MCKVKILLVDDIPEKIRKIRDCIENEKNVIEIAQDAIDCKKKLAENEYDILCLDVLIPLRAGDDTKAENSINIIKEIKANNRYKKPVHILLLTQYAEQITENDDYNKVIQENSCELIPYHMENNAWGKLLIACIELCYKFKISYQNQITKPLHFDVTLIAALSEPELDQILKLGKDSSWRPFKMPNDSIEYYKTTFTTSKGKELTVVAASSNQMGMVAATDLTNKMLNHFHSQIVIMGGIAAGFKGNFGDVLIAKSCDDYGNGKLISKRKRVEEKIIDVEEFKPDPNQIPINSELVSSINQLKRKRSGLNEIKKNWNEKIEEELEKTKNNLTKSKKIKIIEHDLNIEFGPFASGAGVISSKKFIEERLTSHFRKLIGIDMEAYGVYYACSNAINPKPKYVLSIKSMSDKGDNKKNDDYQSYAAYTSAQYIYYLLTESDLFTID